MHSHAVASSAAAATSSGVRCVSSVLRIAQTVWPRWFAMIASATI